jgi:hypothetical protein
MKKSLIFAIAFVMLSAFNLYAFSIVNMVNYQASGGSSWPAITTVWDYSYFTASMGQEVMSVNITPANANNKLRIDVVAHVGATDEQKSERALVVGLFDENDEILAVMQQTLTFNVDSFATAAIPLTYYMTAGTTSTKTFKVRIGVDLHGANNVYDGTVYFNTSAWGSYDSKLTSSITVTEIQP